MITSQRYSLPRGVSTSYYTLLYKGGGRSRSTSISTSRTTYTLRNLEFEQTYNISIRVRMRFRYCGSYLYGEYSDEISITTVETG